MLHFTLPLPNLLACPIGYARLFRLAPPWMPLPTDVGFARLPFLRGSQF